jgi:hypothetical protein
VFTTERRHGRREAAEDASRAADRSRLEEALAPYEHAVIDLRAPSPPPLPPPPAPPVRRARRPRPLVYPHSLD